MSSSLSASEWQWFIKTTDWWRDSEDAGLGTGGDLHLIFIFPEEQCNANSCDPAWCASLRDKAEMCSAELYKINPLTARDEKRKEKVWWWFLLGGRVQWCSSTLWASSVFQLLQIWCLAVWTNSAKEQRKWLTKWLRLLWVLVVQPGVSPHFADSRAGQATYHLQI